MNAYSIYDDRQAHYLPRSRTHLRLLERAADASYYLPKPLDSKGNVFLFAPAGLAPQLQRLFKFPSRRSLIKAQGRERSPDRDVQVEHGRLREMTPFGDVDLNNDFGGGGDESFEQGGPGLEDQDMGGMGDDPYQFDLDDNEYGADDGEEKDQADEDAKTVKRHKQADLKRERDDLFVTTGLLAVFDQAGSTTATQTQQTQTQAGANDDDDDEDRERAKGAWSKNTIKAVSVLKAQVQREGDQVEFAKLAIEHEVTTISAFLAAG